ncbi:MAG: LysM peptidoglycan-binding domain-containing protein [Bacteroidia bacterium]|nr:LysM peptidoglycan-binding domain-containing protein [Bacteroidia bacterium]
MKKIILFTSALLISSFVFGSDENNKKLSKAEYIAMYKLDAIKSMQEFKIPASITMAQAILESGTGNSELAQKANNHFGIKCHKEWTGKKILYDDDRKNECFRHYDNVYESYKDHSQFLTTRDRYSFLFDLEITDYKKWAHGLKKAGYATNPKYAHLLIKIIEENNLTELDKEAISGVKISSTQRQDAEEVTKESKASAANIEQLPANNNVKYVIAKENDSYLSISKEYDMMLWQVHKYNDVDKGADLHVGETVYLKPKRSRSNREYHIAQVGDNLHKISQQYAVKLKKLYKYNTMRPGDKINEGQKIKLQR